MIEKYKDYLELIISTCTGIVGYSIHKSFGWAIFDAFIYPYVWLKWLIYKEINLTLIENCFKFFFN